MTLTTSNATNAELQSYAIKYYDNPYKVTLTEFTDDFNKLVTIKRSFTKFVLGCNVNIKLLVNNIISFYNVFEHHAATALIEYKLESDQKEKMNAFLMFLSFPMIQNFDVDNEIIMTLNEVFK